MCELKIIRTKEECNKNSYIGDYAVANCQLYGGFNAISELKFGCDLYLKIDDEDKNTILVTSDKEHNTTIGEVQMPEAEKKAIIPYLKQNWNNMLYTCKLSQKDEKVKLCEQLRVTIWSKKNIDVSSNIVSISINQLQDIINEKFGIKLDLSKVSKIETNNLNIILTYNEDTYNNVKDKISGKDNITSVDETKRISIDFSKIDFKCLCLDKITNIYYNDNIFFINL